MICVDADEFEPIVLEEFGYIVAVEGLANKINETKLIQFTLNVFGFKQRLQKNMNYIYTE